MINIEDDIQLKQKLLILLLKHDENESQTQQNCPFEWQYWVLSNFLSVDSKFVKRFLCTAASVCRRSLSWQQVFKTAGCCSWFHLNVYTGLAFLDRSFVSSPEEEQQTELSLWVLSDVFWMCEEWFYCSDNDRLSLLRCDRFLPHMLSSCFRMLDS